ncbi:hypothetical protein [Sphingobium sp.]|uniref:hypothetical protein n=1 Tax=Sphingobium sp. TaxID=1912891 RepID=UPI002630F0B7|nr:hypothetical protein [Sphingobium sp.]
MAKVITGRTPSPLSIHLPSQCGLQLAAICDTRASPVERAPRRPLLIFRHNRMRNSIRQSNNYGVAPSDASETMMSSKAPQIADKLLSTPDPM